MRRGRSEGGGRWKEKGVMAIHRYEGKMIYILIIESTDSISRDEPDSPLMQYITNARVSRARYTITLLKYHHRVLRLISNRISV